MSQAKGDENRNKFNAWVSSMKAMDDPDWTHFMYGGKLSPSKISESAGIGRDAFYANGGLKSSLDDLNKELVSMGVFQKRKPSISMVEKDSIDDHKEELVDVKDSARVRDLKRTLKRVQDENAKLSAELYKLNGFKQVLIEMGLYK